MQSPPPSAAASPASGRRRIFPLYGKILLWFLANILLVGGAAFWLVREQFGLDHTFLLTRDGRARLQVRAEQVFDAMAATGGDRAEADEMLARLSDDEQMVFALYDFGGGLVAGGPLPLPPPVRERMRSGRFRGGPGAGPAEGPPAGDQGGGFRRPMPPRPPEAESTADRFEEPRRRERAGPLGLRGARVWREAGRPAELPIESMRTENPTRYWVVARLPPTPEAAGRGRPLVLVGMAETIGQSSLLFDPKPWLLAGLGLLGASAVLWWPFVRSLTRSLAQMRGATDLVARGDFSVRVDDRRGDELGQLGSAINAMTAQLEGFVTGQKRFLGDIAHELCSPLARMEMALAVLEQRTPASMGERVSDVRDEVREMSALVNELLAFSKAGLQGTATAREPVELAPLIESAIEREAPGTPATVHIPADLTVLAAPSLLGRALGNILRNAVHYAGTASPLEITATNDGSAKPGEKSPVVTLSIADHGPGVPPAMLPKLFDPFFRVDDARTRETGGVGLGLAIVKSCVDACGGTVTARARPDGARGLVVDLRLPAAPGTQSGNS